MKRPTITLACLFVVLLALQSCTLRLTPPDKNFTVELKAAGENGVHTYRIPGLVTTKQGTLVAVYDMRYDKASDLQGDIDVGMSRSTDGGRTWEATKVIMDMGEWGGRPENENGIGDPCVLYDAGTNTLWVAALWFSGTPGKMVWNTSRSSFEPNETGQFMLVKSTDDGKSWSPPINITRQVKKTEWNLFFQGPGMGITMADGTLVFPAQFKDAEGLPFSCIVYSTDKGENWHVSEGAKSHTTEAQVVETAPGELMLNMRDDRNRTEKGVDNGRAVYTTHDMGKTWQRHATSNSALPEPNCMASLIKTGDPADGDQTGILLFSNPADVNKRVNMMLKASLDKGNTWPEKHRYLYHAPECYGYSCLTMIDDRTVGVLYEGQGNLIFKSIPLRYIVK